MLSNVSQTEEGALAFNLSTYLQVFKNEEIRAFAARKIYSSEIIETF